MAALRQVAEETDDDYDQFMAECVADVLASTRRITRDQLREVRTPRAVVSCGTADELLTRVRSLPSG